MASTQRTVTRLPTCRRKGICTLLAIRILKSWLSGLYIRRAIANVGRKLFMTTEKRIFVRSSRSTHKRWLFEWEWLLRVMWLCLSIINSTLLICLLFQCKWVLFSLTILHWVFNNSHSAVLCLFPWGEGGICNSALPIVLILFFLNVVKIVFFALACKMTASACYLLCAAIFHTFQRTRWDVARRELTLITLQRLEGRAHRLVCSLSCVHSLAIGDLHTAAEAVCWLELDLTLREISFWCFDERTRLAPVCDWSATFRATVCKTRLATHSHFVVWI